MRVKGVSSNRCSQGLVGVIAGRGWISGLQTVTSRHLHRLCTVEDVAGAVSYLASEPAAYITGQTLILDGGLTSY